MLFSCFCSYSILLIMILLSWNCRGAINLNFGSVVSNMIRKHRPAIMIISETKVCGDKAKGTG